MTHLNCNLYRLTNLQTGSHVTSNLKVLREITIPQSMKEIVLFSKIVNLLITPGHEIAAFIHVQMENFMQREGQTQKAERGG